VSDLPAPETLTLRFATFQSVYKAARALAARLSEALALRGLKLGRDVYGYGNHTPQLDAEGMLHWRLSLLYPQSLQCDVVEDVHEGETLDGQLDAVRFFCVARGESSRVEEAWVVALRIPDAA
jgi:hypothetical protein